MQRREFIRLLSAAAAWPHSAHAQQSRLVGVLMNGSPHEATLHVNVAAFVQGLLELGWIEGRNLRLNVRWNDGIAATARIHAAELVALAPDVILTPSSTNLLALQGATRAIPLVFLQVSDPVAQGFVSNLTKPGGNITGFSAYEFSVGGKWLELLKQLVPALTHVGVMFNPDTSPQSKFFVDAIRAAAASMAVQVSIAPVRDGDDIEAVVENQARQPGGGLILPTDSFIRGHERRIVAATNRSRVPAIAASQNFVDEGGLMYYGPSAIDRPEVHFREAAGYVDRILKGARPGDLPIQAPSKFSLFINRKTATALGLEIPPRLLFTADKVIE